METLRLLVDSPLPGALNMARDEALLEAAGAADAGVTLRWYAWSLPTISLGYFQDHADFEALLPPAGQLAVVRRTTGGGAILHDREVTYSLSVPIDHPLVRGRPNDLYRLAHVAIIRAVGGAARLAGGGCGACGEASQRGPFFCFARRHALDVVVDDSASPEGSAKLAGSAQRRTSRAILQHGSIILDNRFSQQPCATWKALSGVDQFGAAVEKLTPAFEDTLGLAARVVTWREEELRASEQFAEKYGGLPWTVHRRR